MNQLVLTSFYDYNYKFDTCQVASTSNLLRAVVTFSILNSPALSILAVVKLLISIFRTQAFLKVPHLFQLDVHKRLGHVDDEIASRVYLHVTKTMKKRLPKFSELMRSL